MSVNIIQVSYPPPTSPFTPRPLSAVTKCIYHHTAGNRSQTPLELDQEERNATPPYIYVPYTFVADDNALAYAARPMDVESGATFGWNWESVAICAIGNFEQISDGFTGPPSDALIETLIDLGVYVHRLCPNIDDTWSHHEAGQTQNPDQNFETYDTQCCGNLLIAKLPYIKEQIWMRLHSSPPASG